MSYKKGRGVIEKKPEDKEEDLQKISGSIIRNNLMNNDQIPPYMMRTAIINLLKKMNPEFLFHQNKNDQK